MWVGFRGCAQGTSVAVEDIKKCYRLFLDLKRSTEFLKERSDEFMFSHPQSSPVSVAASAGLVHASPSPAVAADGAQPMET